MRISDWSSDVCSSDLRAGVKIYEYCERPMHAKVALIDDDWTTVGSSNLDPLSLFLNLEANLVVRDAPLADTLRRSVQDMMEARKSVGKGERVSVRVDLGGRRSINKNTEPNRHI